MQRTHARGTLYTVNLPGLVLELDCESYPGHGDPDLLGNSRFTFLAEDLRAAGLLDSAEPFTFYTRNGYGEEFDSPLMDTLLGAGDLDAEDLEEARERFAESGEVQTSNVDAAIVTLRAFLEWAEERVRSGPSGTPPHVLRVAWYGECSVFWAFHDLTHALEDVDYSEDRAGIYLEGAWAEDRANLQGAQRAARAGVPVSEILAELAGLRTAFAERFEGERSTALADFLEASGVRSEEGASEYAQRVEDLASDIVANAEPGASLDALTESAWEYVDGQSLSDADAGEVLLYTSNADRAEEWADGDTTDLASRAFGALLGDVEDSLRERFEVHACADCAEALPPVGRRICADCARGYFTEAERLADPECAEEGDTLEAREAEVSAEEVPEEREALAEEVAALELAAREPGAVRVLALEPERAALLTRYAERPSTPSADAETVRRVLRRELGAVGVPA